MPAPDLDLTFAALADPIRRGLIAHLAKGPATAGELAAPHSVTLPAISRHLRVLERAGLIRRRRSGRHHRFRLDFKPIDEGRAWIERQRRFWDEALDSLEAYLTEDQDQPDRGERHERHRQRRHNS
ncbi:MAG: winged helix-turn-helix transcriptional regulator [Alphaproteobacteria bacterium]|nr:winged helix-turn-helix transcriptional regulator [Alphaproteobacteria bacterium]